MQWDPIYSVNIAEIDDQHKKIFEIINSLSVAKRKKDNKIILSVIKELEDYSVYHFTTEEKYFTKFNYPRKEEHIKMHLSYIAQLKKIKKNQDDDVAKTTHDLSEFLKNWWINHIQHEDIGYSDFFNQHGLY